MRISIGPKLALHNVEKRSDLYATPEHVRVSGTIQERLVALVCRKLNSKFALWCRRIYGVRVLFCRKPFLFQSRNNAWQVFRNNHEVSIQGVNGLYVAVHRQTANQAVRSQRAAYLNETREVACSALGR